MSSSQLRGSLASRIPAALALFLGVARRSRPALWLAPVATVVLLAGALIVPRLKPPVVPAISSTPVALLALPTKASGGRVAERRAPDRASDPGQALGVRPTPAEPPSPTPAAATSGGGTAVGVAAVNSGDSPFEISPTLPLAPPNLGETPVVGFPGRIWLPSPYHRRRIWPIDTVVLHTTEGGLQATLNEFQSSPRHVSAHYVVARDGRVFQMVSEDQIAFHAGFVSAGPESRFLGTNPNAYSIGIEIVNPSIIRGPVDFPMAQKVAVFALVKDVVERNHIPIDRDHLVGHSEIDPTSRKDPGPGFPWDELLAYLQT